MIDVLIVEDEVKLAQVVMLNLEIKEFNVRHASTTNEALDSFRQKKPDIVILDVMMPGLDGFAFASKIREQDTLTPIIFLTARTSTEDLLNGFKVGGNDYLKKPFVMEELIARINALIDVKKKRKLPADCIHIGKYILHPARQILQYEDKVINLSYRQSVLLRMLYEKRNALLLRDDVVNELRDTESIATGRSLDVFVCRLRKLLINDPNIQIKNVRGMGYKMMLLQ